MGFVAQEELPYNLKPGILSSQVKRTGKGLVAFRGRYGNYAASEKRQMVQKNMNIFEFCLVLPVDFDNCS